MSDKWETVSHPKRNKPKTPQSNGQAVGSVSITGLGQRQQQQSTKKTPKPKKYSAKTPASFPLVDDDEFLDLAPEMAADKLGAGDKAGGKKKADAAKPKAAKQGSAKPKEKKRDLESTLAQISAVELKKFFEQLQMSGSMEDVCLSWIKYSADALNTKLSSSSVTPPDPQQWPNDLDFPTLPKELGKVVVDIIGQTSQARTDIDVLGASFTSLLATIPTLVQRGDAGWGHLIFLREMCRMDPSLPIRRFKSISELMESYGNRREIGLCVLWVAAQSGVDSPYVLKIASQHLMPYYGFKNYKQFVLAALETIVNSANMGVENLIEVDEFEEFFEAAFDPKKRRDLEKIYPRVRELVLKGVRDCATPLFLKFFQKLGQKDFMPLSVYGREVLDILNGCLENDVECILTWRENITSFPKETTNLLQHLARVPESIKYFKALESKFIQSDHFAIAAVKNPELLRIAKKLQTGVKQAEASRKRFSWKAGIFLLLLTIGGLLWLDVTENGKGSFEKSNTGKLLQKYGALEHVLVGVTFISGLFKYLYEYASVLFRSIYEGVQPLLQSLGEKVQVYIPQLTEYFNIVRTFIVEAFSNLLKFLQDKVFIGVLSPENLRKVTKESLTFIWTNIYLGMEKLYEFIEKFIK